MDLSRIKEKIAKLPQAPGVYVFRDAKKEIIYIGKATNLRSRVGSYFRNYRGSDRPIETMIHQVADIAVEETKSVLEALILESNLIKKHQPKYNVKEKDDKSFCYFVITKEEFPRIIIVRGTDMEKTKAMIKKSFGPYTSKKQMEVALKIMRQIFPFHSLQKKSEQHCLDFQLGRCPGPYANGISKQDYAKNIRGIQMILDGKKNGLLKKLEKEMLAHAKKEEFEKANELKKKIFALEHIRDVALISDDNFEFKILNLKSNPNDEILKVKDFRIEAYDISNISGQYAVGSMVVFENGVPSKSEYRKFKIKTVVGANDVGMMAEVLFRRFSRQDWPMPDLILLDGGQGHLNMAKKILQELHIEIPMVAIAKGPTRKKLELVGIEALQKKEKAKAKSILGNQNLLKSIMDEAHRFAITYHRKLRQKSFKN